MNCKLKTRAISTHFKCVKFMQFFFLIYIRCKNCSGFQPVYTVCAQLGQNVCDLCAFKIAVYIVLKILV